MTQGRGHRHRGGRAERHRRRRALALHAGRRAARAAHRRFDASRTPPRSPGQVPRLRRRGPRRPATGRADRPVDLDVAGRGPAGARRRQVRPGRPRPVRHLGRARQRLRRQRVRPAGDPGTVEPGTRGGQRRTSRSPGSTRPASGRPRSCTAPRARPRCWSPTAPAGWTAWATPAGSSGGARPAVLAGGTEAPLSPYALVCQRTSGRMTVSRDPRPATSRSTPTANGYAPGEGGAVLVVEDAATPPRSAVRSRSTARSPGTPRRTTPTTTRIPRRTAAQLVRAMRQGARRRRADAGRRRRRLRRRRGHARARRAGGARPIREVFGDRAGGAGHRAAGLRRPAVLRRRRADRGDRAAGDAGRHRPRGRQPDHARAVRPGPRPRAARRCDADVVLVNARGYGGFNSSIVLKRLPRGGAA